MRVRINELVIRDFRGFRGEHRMVFSDGINIIHGPVGAGKTSIVQAIEYASMEHSWRLRRGFRS